jgi:hypothetical protein
LILEACPFEEEEEMDLYRRLADGTLEFLPNRQQENNGLDTF